MLNIQMSFRNEKSKNQNYYLRKKANYFINI